MMKKTQWISLWMTIRKNLVSFIAIVLFISLGIAMFCGMIWCSLSLNNYTNGIMKDGKVRFCEVIFPYGASDSDIDKLRQIEGVESAEGASVTYADYMLDGARLQTAIYSLTKDVDIPQQVEGVLPTCNGEIAVEAYFAKSHGIKIGDTITFEKNDDGKSRAISKLMAIDTDNFNIQNDLYSIFEPSTQGMEHLKTNTFKVTALMETPSIVHSNSGTYGFSFTNGRQINCFMFVNEQSFDINATNGYNRVLVYGGLTENDDVLSKEFIDRLSDFSEKVKNEGNAITSARYSLIKEKIDKVFEQTQLGLNSLSESDLAYVSALQNGVSQVVDSGCSVTSMNRLQSYIIGDFVENIVQKTTFSLSSLFIVVALLVCYCVISRLVHEGVKQIGTKKALGMETREIRREYTYLVIVALVIGSIMGAIIGYFLVEQVLNVAMQSSLVVGGLKNVFRVRELFIIIPLEAIFVLGATFIAVRNVLKRNAVSLLSGESVSKRKTHFYEKLKIFNKLPLLSQVIVNNCVNDKRRVVSTLVGVACCAALIVTAFTYSDIANANVGIQFNEYYHFDYYVGFDSNIDSAKNEIAEILENKNMPNTLIYDANGYIFVPDGSASLLKFVVTMDKETLPQIITPVTDYDNHKDAYKGFWLSESLKKFNDLQEGQALNIVTLSGENKEIVPNGYYHNYLLSAHAFCDSATYKEMFGTEPIGNTFLVRSSLSEKEMNALFKDVDGYISSVNLVDEANKGFEQIRMITLAMLALYSVLSIAMATLVLLNLLYMFVEEKKKELTVLIINGYKIKDAKKYIYRDTILLTFIGIIFGVLLGQLVGNLAVSAFESSQITFRAVFDWKSSIIGVASTAILTFIMSLISLKRIKNLNLTDLSK